MKTIKENAKAYDELINRLEDVKDAIKKQNYGIAMDVLCKPYPEFQITTQSTLQKSEGERTWIINYLSNRILNSTIIAEKENLKKAVAWLEKQGEQEYNITGIGSKHAQGKLGEMIKNLKPTDKVEPKFKVGDWVVRGSTIAQILDIQEQYYVGLDINGKDFTSSRFLDDDKIHLWTINDAKDGDVLYLQKDGKEHIIIYKGVIKERFRTFVSAYCAYNGIVDAFCFADVSRYVDIAYRGIMPATKEQRDLLFSKMKEAGYTWDAEKKELKKEKEVYNLHNYLYGKQNPIWSEEDEEIYRKCICAMRASACGFPEEEKFVEQVDNWFKCLKERYTWEPSDEQMDALRYVTNFDYGGHKATLVLLYEQLKKLKE